MKKFGFIAIVVMAFVLGICGRNIVNEVKRQNDERFVQTAFYADELMEYAPHKKMSGDRSVEYVLDWNRGLFARGKGNGKELVFTVYNGEGVLTEVVFTREYRKADDQSRVYIKRNGVQDGSCVTYTGEMLQNVIRTELSNVL